MMDSTVALIRRWTTQDVARTNAAEAAATLQRHRRQLDEVDAYVARLAHERSRVTAAGTDDRAFNETQTSAFR
jgi:hypothetical protein